MKAIPYMLLGLILAPVTLFIGVVAFAWAILEGDGLHDLMSEMGRVLKGWFT